MSLPLHVIEEGHGDDLVVLVHGVLDRAAAFHGVVGHLIGDTRVIRYDRRGYGASSLAPEQPPNDLHRHVDDLLDVLAGRRAVLAGHSFGGNVALGAALRAPELVRAIALYETAMPWIPAFHFQQLNDLVNADDPESAVAAVRMVFGPTIDRMTPARRELRRALAPIFRAEQRSIRSGVAPFDVRGVRSPIVFGSSTVPHPTAEHLREQGLRVEAVELPGAGHNAHRTQPEAFAGLVRRALALAAEEPAGGA